MQAFLTIASKHLAYADAEATSNPSQREFDWQLSIKSLTVSDPRTFSGSLGAGASVTVFDGTRSTSLDGTTAFGVALSTLDAGTRYRFTWTGGTNPVLRTDRSLALSGQQVTVAVNANSTVNMTLGAGSFAGVQVGDVVFVPHTTTGDAANALAAANGGFWTVLAVVSSTNLQLGRPAGTSFEAAAETVTLASNAQLQAFSAAGVQVGDSVAISAGFSTASHRTYAVDRVTATWFEVLSSAAIPAESGKTPGVAGMVFYIDGKRFLHVEVTQEAVAQLDGDSGETVRLSPAQPGDRKQPGWLQKFGSVRKLVLVNKSTATLDYVAHTAR